ncbi:MAG: hypothetical protein ACO1TE_12300 [Prosthecobacter sp.]
MKTRILLLIAAALPGTHGVCHAQSPVQEVIDHALIQQTMTGNRDLLAVLQQQLAEAQKQTQSLTDQLTRMGDPASVTLPSLELIRQDIAKSADNAANGGAAREQRLINTTGAEAFGDNAYGLVEGVGPTVTLKHGTEATEDDTVVNRDPAKYKLHAAMMQDLNNLDAKSKETDARIARLEQERPALLDQVSTAPDEATVMKLQVALQAIDAQIASSKADLIKSKQDYDILNEKLKLQAQITSRAKAEEHDLESKSRADAAAAARAAAAANPPATSTGSTSPFSGLRWGRTTNTPP